MKPWRKLALLVVAPCMALVTGPLSLAPAQAHPGEGAHGHGSGAAESTTAKSTAAKPAGAKTPSIQADAADAQLFALENILVFSKTAGFRHSSIGPGIAAIEQLGTDNGFNVDATEDAAAFTLSLIHI